MTHLSIIDGLINQWIDQSMDGSINGLINFFQQLYFSIFLIFLIFSIYFFKKIVSLELSGALYSSRTLGIHNKYLLSIEGSILS